jgi:hypothetical protein
LALDLFFSFISAWRHTIMEMRTAIWSKAMRDNQKMPGRWNFSLIAVVLVLFLSTACTPGSMAQKPSVPVASASIPGSPELNSLLRRPLHLPSLHTENPCPTSPARRVFPAFGPAQGNGPAYEAATYDQAPSPSVLLYADAAHFGGGGSANQGWGGQKVLWFVDPRYQGYVLVRGHQIDGPHGMRFQTSLDPQLVINTADGGTPWPSMPSYTRLQAPGCYAYQVDGTTFSDEIIFQATLGGF